MYFTFFRCICSSHAFWDARVMYGRGTELKGMLPLKKEVHTKKSKICGANHLLELPDERQLWTLKQNIQPNHNVSVTYPMLDNQLTRKLKFFHQDVLSQTHESRRLTGSSWSEMASKQLRDSTNTEQSHQPCSTVFLHKMVMLEIQGGIRSTISLGRLCFISMSSKLPCWNKICCEKKKWS